MSNSLNEEVQTSANNVVNYNSDSTSTLSSAPSHSPPNEITKVEIFKLSKNKRLPLLNQQLTIQDAFDPQDNITIHATTTVPGTLTARKNQPLSILGKIKTSYRVPSRNEAETPTKSTNAMPPININPNANVSTTNITDLFESSSSLYNLNIKGRQATVNTTYASLNRNTNSGGYLDIVKSYKATVSKYKNSQGLSLNDTKYYEYKKRWNEILKREKRVFDTKWSAASNSSTQANSLKVEDFEMIKSLGNGSFGKVILAKQVQTQKYFALKVLDKMSVVKSKQVDHTLNEKKILSCVNFTFIASFSSSFKDNANLFILLEFVPGGEMFKHLVKNNRFSENLTRFYCSQVILAIEYLHNLDIIHRDLKPENTVNFCLFMRFKMLYSLFTSKFASFS